VDSAMSEQETEKKEKVIPGMPKYYYWGKDPRSASRYTTWAIPLPKSGDPVSGFANDSQKKFYRIILAFRVGKVAALIVFVYLVYLVMH
jgi:hypothetical protein